MNDDEMYEGLDKDDDYIYYTYIRCLPNCMYVFVYNLRQAEQPDSNTPTGCEAQKEERERPSQNNKQEIKLASKPFRKS